MMHCLFTTHLDEKCCKSLFSFLAWAYLLGLILGVFVSFSAGDSLFPLMRLVASGQASIVSLLLSGLLPLLFSAFAVYIGCFWLLIPVAFGKAFLFAFLGLGLLVTYGDAGWLIRLLLTFSELCSLPLLWYFWFRTVDRPRNSGPAMAACGLLIVGLSFFDYSVVLPFAAGLLS